MDIIQLHKNVYQQFDTTSNEEEMSEFQKVSHSREFVDTQIFKRLTSKKAQPY